MITSEIIIATDCPIIRCDQCERRIKKATEGVAFWLGPGAQVRHFHREVCFYKATNLEEDDWSGTSQDLDQWLVHLLNNTAVNIEKARANIAQLNSLSIGHDESFSSLDHL